MDFVALRYFLEVVRSGSIRRASEVLNVAPSAVSRQVANLEANFGSPLIERHALGVRPTPAGEILARQARATIRDFERLRSEIDDLQLLKRGQVRMFCSEGAVADFLFSSLVEFAKQYPGITYDVVVAGSRKAVDAVAQEECDLAIVFNPPPHPDVVVLSSAKHPVCVVMAPSHPLGNRAAIPLRELTTVPVCLLDHTFSVRHLLDQAFALEDIPLFPAMTINSVELSKIYARDGIGVSLMPLYAARREVRSGSLIARLLDSNVLSNSTVGLCMHKTRTIPLAAETLMKTLVKRFNQFANPEDLTSPGMHG